MPAKRQLSIAEVAEQTGLSQAALRMWEKRYGWPKPTRNASGYRVYSKDLVADLHRLATLLERGFAVGEIIRDGAPTWPSTLAEKPERPRFNFKTVPEPRTSDGKRVRAKLEAALLSGDAGTIAWAQAQLPLLHPSDRGPAVTELLKIAGM